MSSLGIIPLIAAASNVAAGSRRNKSKDQYTRGSCSSFSLGFLRKLHQRGVPCLCRMGPPTINQKSKDNSGNKIGNSSNVFVKDPTLSVCFPVELRLPQAEWSNSRRYTCMAATPRCMRNCCWIPAARAYSLGVYVQSDAVKAWKEHAIYQQGIKQQEENVAKTASGDFDEENARVLLDAEIPKVLCMNIIGDKSKKHFLNGMRNALYNALRANLMPEPLHQSFLSDLNELIKCLSKGVYSPGSRLYISFVPGHQDTEDTRTECTNKKCDIGELSINIKKMETNNTTQDRIRQCEGRVLVFLNQKVDDVDDSSSNRNHSGISTPIEEGAVLLCEIYSDLLLHAFHALYIEGPAGTNAYHKNMASEIRKQVALYLNSEL